MISKPLPRFPAGNTTSVVWYRCQDGAPLGGLFGHHEGAIYQTITDLQSATFIQVLGQRPQDGFENPGTHRFLEGPSSVDRSAGSTAIQTRSATTIRSFRGFGELLFDNGPLFFRL